MVLFTSIPVKKAGDPSSGCFKANEAIIIDARATSKGAEKTLSKGSIITNTRSVEGRFNAQRAPHNLDATKFPRDMNS